MRQYAGHPVFVMSMDGATARGLQPPQITDASDDDKPDEVLSLLGAPDKTNWPPADANAAVIDKLTAYGLKLSRNKALKAIGLAIIAGVAGIAYTYILLSVR